MSYMFVRPPAVRSARNPRRRPLPTRGPINEVNRSLLRQFVRNRRSDPRHESYVLEIREGPAINGNTNAAAGKSIPQPWVTIRDSIRSQGSVGLPVSICDALLKHLLTCAVTEKETHSDSSEDSDVVSGSDTQRSSPAQGSGDGKSPVDETASETASSAKKVSKRTKAKVFQLSRLKPIRIMCEATGCTLEVTARDPVAKRASSNPEDSNQVVQIDPSRRWIISTPADAKPTVVASGEQVADSNGVNTTTSARRKQPWETRGSIELHETLIPQLSAFLADVVTRYRAINLIPEVRSLYSASGGRRFFFDLRDTRWGKRLHISQVTDLHRNVIGIPIESLVSFRSRLDMIIANLGLEEQHSLRSTIYGDIGDRAAPRRSRRITASERENSNEGVDSADGSAIRKSTSNDDNRREENERNGGVRNRRRPRTARFTGGNVERYANGPRRAGGRRFWRDRPIPRRNRNPHQLNQTNVENGDSDGNVKSGTQTTNGNKVETNHITSETEVKA